MVINISNGMNTGAHNGTSPVERHCERFTDGGDARGRVIVKSAGNESRSARHSRVLVAQDVNSTISWVARTVGGPAAPAHAANDVLEGWFASANSYRFRLITPNGTCSPWLDGADFRQLDEILDNGNRVQASLEQFHRSGGAEVHIEIAPGERGALEEGRWALEVEAQRVVNQEPLHLWVEALPHRELRFVDSVDASTTITVPGTAPSVIVVAALRAWMARLTAGSDDDRYCCGLPDQGVSFVSGILVKLSMTDVLASTFAMPAGEYGSGSGSSDGSCIVGPTTWSSSAKSAGEVPDCAMGVTVSRMSPRPWL